MTSLGHMPRAPTIKIPPTKGSSFKGCKNNIALRPILPQSHLFHFRWGTR